MVFRTPIRDAVLLLAYEDGMTAPELAEAKGREAAFTQYLPDFQDERLTEPDDERNKLFVHRAVNRARPGRDVVFQAIDELDALAEYLPFLNPGA